MTLSSFSYLISLYFLIIWAYFQVSFPYPGDSRALRSQGDSRTFPPRGREIVFLISSFWLILSRLMIINDMYGHYSVYPNIIQVDFHSILHKLVRYCESQKLPVRGADSVSLRLSISKLMVFTKFIVEFIHKNKDTPKM